jgi:hypothetical protein
MTEILPAVPQNPSEPRWWWQPLWHRHPIRFALVVLLVVAGGVAWGLPAGLALRGVVFPPKPPAVVTPAPTTPTPTPTRTRRRRTYAPQPVYTPPADLPPHPDAHEGAQALSAPPAADANQEPSPYLSAGVHLAVAGAGLRADSAPATPPDSLPKAKSPEHDASSSTKNSWSLIAWLL